MLDRLSGAKFIKILFFFIALIVIYNIFLFITRLGETKVSLEVIPRDARVSVNGERVGKTVYLSPGVYTFSASKEGWEDYSIEVDVSSEDTEVGLIPAPDSIEADNYLLENPDIQLKREAIGGINAALVGERYDNTNPLISLLPHSDLVGHFSIDYGSSDDREYDSFILISGSANGRKNALDWIKDQGIDPTNLEIRYEDYINPLSEGV